MIDIQLKELALWTLTLTHGLLAVVTWRATVLWNGLARSLTAISGALALAAGYFAVTGPWPRLGHEYAVSGIWLLLIGTGWAAIYFIQRETRRATGGYKIAQAQEVVQQSKETARLADETQRVADETSRVADAVTSQDVLSTAASTAVDVLSTAATKAAELLRTVADDAPRATSVATGGETSRLVEQTGRVADETSRVADAAEVLNDAAATALLQATPPAKKEGNV